MTDYDNFAEEYEFWIQTTARADRYTDLPNFFPKSREKALDAGCGAGMLSVWLSEYFRHVAGSDISTSMLELAAKRQKEKQKDNIIFVCSDLAKLPFPDHSFDFVASEFSLHDTRVAETLPELRRVLKPGGRMMIRDRSPADPQRYSSPSWRTRRTLETAPEYEKLYGSEVAQRLVRFETSPGWLKQISEGNYLSPPEFRRIFSQFFPGCRFEIHLEIMTVCWEAPEAGNQQHTKPYATPPVCRVPFPKAPASVFTREEIETSIPERFRHVVQKYPDRAAIMTEEKIFSYGELDRISNRIAHAVLTRDFPDTEPAAILLDHGAKAISAIMGILKAGKGYAALDLSQPPEYLSAILENAKAPLILTNQQHIDLAAKLIRKGLRLINIDDLEFPFPEGQPEVKVSADSLAAVFYTSGSSGKPKGVARNHRVILHSVWRNTLNYHISQGDRHSSVFFPGFSISVPDIFDTLLNGAALCPHNLRETTPNLLYDWLRQEEISIFCPPATFFRNFLDTLTDENPLPKLRLVILSGQTVYKNDVKRFKRHFSENTFLLCQLASTEAGLIANFPIDREAEVTDKIVPAGYAAEDKEILLQNESGQRIGINEIGEIAVRSRYLSIGYWNNPELTAQKFLPDPEGGERRIYLTGDLGRMRADGCLEHLGRKDFQVKIRGFRVEMSAVETALHGADNVKEAAVAAHDHPSGDKYIAAYIVPAKQPPPTISDLRRYLSEKLPEYMIPSAFVVMEKLPLTTSGKVDRRSLPEPDRTRLDMETPFIAPRTPTEKRLAQIWAEILELDRVGVHDIFSELGGNSLQAIRIVSRIQKEFNLELPLRYFLETPTVAEQAEIIAQNHDSSTLEWSLLVPIRKTGAKPPLFYIPPAGMTMIPAAMISEYLGPDQPFYGIQHRGIDRDEAPHTTVEEMAASYILEIQKIQPGDFYFLLGHCFGGVVVFEMALQLLSSSQRVALLGILDTLLPPGFHHKVLQRIVREKGIHPSRVTFPRNDPFRERSDFTPEQNRRIRQVEDAHHKARIAYIPRQMYPGKISFFRSDTPHAIHRSGWEELADKIEFYDIPGDHHSIIERSHVHLLGAKLKACLEQAQADETYRWMREFSLKSPN